MVICSDCYDNANIYSRTREYCPYAYITDEDPLDQTLSSLMVQMSKEPYSVCTQHEAPAMDNISADRDMSVFLTNHDRTHERKPCSQPCNTGKYCAVLLLLYLNAEIASVFFWMWYVTDNCSPVSEGLSTPRPTE